MTSRRRIGVSLLVAGALLPMGSGTGEAGDVLTRARWVGPVNDCQYERVVYLDATATPAEVVVVGSSLAFRGIHADPLRRGLGDPSAAVFNFAIPGASLDPVQRWLIEVVVPLADPEVVVIAFASRDLNPGGERQSGHLAEFDASPAWAFVERGDLGFALEQIAAGIRAPRHRAALRRPDLVPEPLRDGWDPEAAGYRAPGWKLHHLWPSHCNQIRDEDRRVYPGGGAHDRQWIREHLLTPYDPSGGIVALRRMVRSLQATGATPVLVNLPATLIYREAHPGGVEGYEAYRARIRRVAETEGVLLLDAVEMFAHDETRFADSRHLNVPGADRLSRLLGRVLRHPERPRVVCVRCE